MDVAPIQVAETSSSKKQNTDSSLKTETNNSINISKASSEETDQSVESKLKELKNLYNKKLISKSVYDQKQRDLLSKM